MTAASLTIDGVEVLVEGQGEEVVLMVHGWPDTHRLWDAQVVYLLARFPGQLRCVRFTLPGFDPAQPGPPRSFDGLANLIGAIADATSPGRAVTLLLHDWGCVFGYRFAQEQPERVARIVGVDIGDFSDLQQFLSPQAKLMIAGYQVWLALGWRLGQAGVHQMADGMTRWMARLAGSRLPGDRIGWTMNYPYAVVWTGALGGPGQSPAFRPSWPMLYFYGRRKPFQFQSPDWLAWLATQPGCEVHAFDTGHWVMLEQAEAFNTRLGDWLSRSGVGAG